MQGMVHNVLIDVASFRSNELIQNLDPHLRHAAAILDSVSIYPASTWWRLWERQ
jgi:hypothetical protein